MSVYKLIFLLYSLSSKYITKKMLKSSHPFNTYFHTGLPPTPISYPGKNALNALKNVKNTNYFYFVADGKGRHRFSETYDLHKQNINLWKKLKNLLEKSRYALSSMENYASFFILDCFLNNIYLISKKIFYAKSGIIKFKLVKRIQGYKVLKINVNKRNLIFLHKKLVIFLRN